MSVKSWIEVAETPDKYCAIHPSGSDPAEWERSGKHAADVLMHLVKKEYPNAKSIMEYGCGTCRILKHIKGYELVGVDVAKPFVEESRSNGFNCFLLDDYDGQVDIIFALTVFIHLNKTVGKAALKYCFDHLKEGGTAYLQIPIYDVDHDPETWCHVGTWKKETFEKACHDVGFQILEYRASAGKLNYHNIGINHGFYQRLRKPVFIRE
jgi:SAM-dependent methyltransferase